jgi:uncharacterized protein with PIN domain
MIVDASALIAILRDEPEAAPCAEAIEGAPLLFVGDDFSRTDLTPALK